MSGTLVNALAIILGGLVGLAIHSRLPARVTEIAFQGIGLFTIFLGFSLATPGSQPLFMVMSLVAGSILGELMRLNDLITNAGDKLGMKLKRKGSQFSEGFITATLLFAVGSMAILGAIEEGMGGKPQIYFTKAILDGFSAIALAASFGLGVIFSALPVFIYQGLLTLLAGYLKDFLTLEVIREITATGGLILIGLGMNILGLIKIRVINMLPALAIVAVAVFLLG